MQIILYRHGSVSAAVADSRTRYNVRDVLHFHQLNFPVILRFQGHEDRSDELLATDRYADLPFFDQFRIPAGKPDELFSDPPANTHKVVRHLAKENRYVIRVKGDSMAPRIQDGDLILVDYIKEPRPGNIVVATVNGGVVVKKYLHREGRVVLKSMNPQYADIEIKETDQFEIKGVVLRIVEGAL